MMRKFLLRMTAVSLATITALPLLYTSTSAATVSSGDGAEVSAPAEATATARLTDLETGEVTYLQLSSDGAQKVPGEDQQWSQSFATITGPKYRSTVGGSRGSDVIARATINDDKLGERIRINGVSGSWTPSSSQIVISNREVHYTDGALLGANGAHKYPTGYSFSYSTGWPFVDFTPTTSNSGARVFTAIKYNVSGMGSDFSLELTVTV